MSINEEGIEIPYKESHDDPPTVRIELPKRETPPPREEIAQPAEKAPVVEAEAKPESRTEPEFTGEPRDIDFAALKIEEDLNADLLTAREKGVYQAGFADLEKMAAATNDAIEKMYLTHPRYVSAIIGLQSYIDMREGDAGLLYRAFRKAGIDPNENYRFYEHTRQGQKKYWLVNLRSARNVLVSNREELGLTLDDSPTNDAVEGTVIDLLSEKNVSRLDLAEGFLNGYAPNDVRDYAKNDSLEGGNGTASSEWQRADEKVLEGTQIGDLNLRKLKQSGDFDWVGRHEENEAVVRGFGIDWRVSDPSAEATKAHLQKLLQMDRELGLINFVKKVRSTFNRDDAIRTIEVAKSLKS